MQKRSASTYDLIAKSRICLLDLRDAPNRELEAIRQHKKNMQPYMLIAQHNDDSLNDESLRALCDQQANQGEPGSLFLTQFAQLPKGTGFDMGHQLGFLDQPAWTNPIVC